MFHGGLEKSARSGVGAFRRRRTSYSQGLHAHRTDGLPRPRARVVWLMTRRKKLAIAGIVVALALAAVVVVAVALRPASLQERLEQVREGMTYAEVIEIMGEPERSVSPRTRSTPLFAILWEDRRGNAVVYFDREKKAYRKDFFRIEPTGFLDRVLAWLGF